MITQSVYIQLQKFTIFTKRHFRYGVDSSVFGYGLAGLYLAMKISLNNTSGTEGVSRNSFVISVAVSTISWTFSSDLLKLWLPEQCPHRGVDLQALKTSYDLYRTLLSVKQSFDKDAYSDCLFRVVEIFGN